MASSFSALPVVGESFLLETDHGGRRWSILVDGGQTAIDRKGVHPLLKALRQASPHLTQIDVAICTHNDHDHAGGFPTFLDAWLRDGGHISEVWLPWRWAAALPSVLVDPVGFMGTLVEGATAAATLLDEGESSDRKLAEMVEGQDLSVDESVRRRGLEVLKDLDRLAAAGEDQQRNIATMVAELQSRPARVFAALGLTASSAARANATLEETDAIALPLSALVEPRLMTWFPLADRVSIRAHDLLRSTTETAEKIRAIAATALRHSILIRWFDFGEFENGHPAKGGESDFLEPCNTVEMSAPPAPPPALQLFFSLKLSEQNVESLVFQRIESDTEPGVFFLGDSRLAFGISSPGADFTVPSNLPRRAPIVTAAHHGSRVNDRAYEVLKRWLGSASERDIYFVRNGGTWNQTLGQYLAQPERRCAQCHQCFKGGRDQMVVVNTKGDVWDWPPGAKPCGTPRRNSISIRAGGL